MPLEGQSAPTEHTSVVPLGRHNATPGYLAEQLRYAFEEARGLFELAIPVWAMQLAVVVAFIASPRATFPFGLALGFVLGSDLLLLAFLLPAMARFDRASLLAAKWDPWPRFEDELRAAYELRSADPLPPGSWFPMKWFDYFEGPISGGKEPQSRGQSLIASLRTRQLFAFLGLSAYLIAWGWFVASRCWGTPFFPTFGPIAGGWGDTTTGLLVAVIVIIAVVAVVFMARYRRR